MLKRGRFHFHVPCFPSGCIGATATWRLRESDKKVDPELAMRRVYYAFRSYHLAHTPQKLAAVDGVFLVVTIASIQMREHDFSKSQSEPQGRFAISHWESKHCDS